MKSTIDMDIGGTFTDVFVTRGGECQWAKVPTTLHDVTVCFMDGIREAARKFGLELDDLLSDTIVIRLSTTIGTNTIIQKNGPKLGVIVTQGSEEMLCASPSLKGILDGMVMGVKEGIDEHGIVKQPLDCQSVILAMEKLLDTGARAIVVVLRNSGANSSHEQQVKEIIRGEYPRQYLGSVPVLAASDVTTHRDDEVRANTAILNAYLHKDMVRFLYRAEAQARNHGYGTPLLVAHSSGGAARVAKTVALSTYNSGPAAGLLGCNRIAGELYGVKDFVSVDVGGTSVDVGIVSNGQVVLDREPYVEGIRIGLPMVTVAGLSGGGGAVLSVEPESDILRVGPRSAGALPGPAAFDLGGVEPTITDADLVLGNLNPEYFLGGRKKLNRDRALSALGEKVASQIGLSNEEAAWKAIQTVEHEVGVQIGEEIRKRGLRSKNLTMFAFGGGGGMRCCGYASLLGIRRIVVFGFNAVGSAFGSSTLDVVHSYERVVDITISSVSTVDLTGEYAKFNQVVTELRDRAVRDIKGEGFDTRDAFLSLELELQGAHGRQVVDSGLLCIESARQAEGIVRMYTARNNSRKETASGDLKIERIAVKVGCPVPHVQLPTCEYHGTDPRKALDSTRNVYWDGGYSPTKIYRFDRLQCGNRIEGPSVVEASDTTYIVPPGWTYTVDKYLNALLEVK